MHHRLKKARSTYFVVLLILADVYVASVPTSARCSLDVGGGTALLGPSKQTRAVGSMRGFRAGEGAPVPQPGRGDSPCHAGGTGGEGSPGAGPATGTSARWSWGLPCTLALEGGGRASLRCTLNIFDSNLLAPRHGQTDSGLNTHKQKTFAFAPSGLEKVGRKGAGGTWGGASPRCSPGEAGRQAGLLREELKLVDLRWWVSPWSHRHGSWDTRERWGGGSSLPRGFCRVSVAFSLSSTWKHPRCKAARAGKKNLKSI